MGEPPSQLDGARVLLWCHLRHEGQTSAGAAICQYDEDGSIYMFYCNERWGVVGDTDHSTIAEATEALDQHYPEAFSRLRRLI
jgi:hypothetical protein